jgi:predicted RNase H-like nuclease
MDPAVTFIGIDGCRAGWFCVILDEGDAWSCRLAPDAHAVAELAMEADSVLIDIPIGLSDSGPDGRLCDREARQLLGRGRASSVFSAPARRTLAAASYPDALVLNRQATGRGLSKQAWNIVPKIREIDTLLCGNRALRGVLRESHPELCFRALNGKQAMQYNKKKEEGQQQRLAVLEHYFPQCRTLFECGNGEVWLWQLSNRAGQSCDRRAGAADGDCVLHALIKAFRKLDSGSWHLIPFRI